MMTHRQQNKRADIDDWKTEWGRQQQKSQKRDEESKTMWRSITLSRTLSPLSSSWVDENGRFSMQSHDVCVCVCVCSCVVPGNANHHPRWWNNKKEKKENKVKKKIFPANAFQSDENGVYISLIHTQNPTNIRGKISSERVKHFEMWIQGNIKNNYECTYRA